MLELELNLWFVRQLLPWDIWVWSQMKIQSVHRWEQDIQAIFIIVSWLIF